MPPPLKVAGPSKVAQKPAPQPALPADPLERFGALSAAADDATNTEAKKALEAELEPMLKGNDKADVVEMSTRLSKAEEALTSKQAELSKAAGDLAKLEADLKGKKPSPSQKTQLVQARAKVAAAAVAVTNLEAAVKGFDAQLGKAHDAVIRKTKGVRDSFDGRADAASLSRAEQQRLLGAPVHGVSEQQALEHDLAKEKKLAPYSTFSATVTLFRQLEGASPEYQAKLVAALKPELEQMVKSSEYLKTPQSMLGMLGSLQGPAKQQLQAMVEKLPKSGQLALYAEAKRQLDASGGYAGAAALAETFPKGSELRASMVQQIDLSVSAAESEWKAAKKKSDALLTDFSRATYGFSQAVDPKDFTAYRDAYLQKHADAFAKTEAAAKKYLEVAQVAAGGAFDELADGHAVRFQATVKELGNNLPALLDSDAGKALLQSSLEAQQAQQPNFLDALSKAAKKGKTALTAAKGVSNVLAKGMVKLATMRGVSPEAMEAMVEKNATLLGIPDKVKSQYAKAIAAANDPKLAPAERMKLLKSAANEIEGGKQGGKVMSAVGLLLTGPSVINGWIDFGDKSNVEQLQQIVSTVNVGKDLVGLFSDAAVLGKLGRVTGGVGGVLSLMQGIDELSDGKYVDGGTSLASAVGAGLMFVPGGQLPGAVITVGAAIVRYAFGSDPAADAEAKTEKATREFLVAMQIRPEIADELKDVLQTSLRGVGAALPQLEARMGLAKGQLLHQLNQMDPERVRAFVDMVKRMPSDDQWQFHENTPPSVHHAVDSARVQRPSDADPRYHTPLTVRTAVEWMHKNGFSQVRPDAYYDGKAGFGKNPHAVEARAN